MCRTCMVYNGKIIGKIKGIFTMKNKIIGVRKINITKVMIAATIVFFLLIFSIVVIYKMIIKNKIKNETNKYAEVLYKTEQNQIATEIMDKQLKEEKIKNKYRKLNQEEIEKFDNIYKHSDQKRVFLTFDDGPSRTVTPLILDLLKKENVKGNFFVLGYRVEESPDLLKREYQEGHFIGNHGYSHKYREIYKDVNTVFDEYNKTNELIKKACGNKDYESLVFRFPGGVVGGPYNDLKKEASTKMKEQGIACVDWNALTSDSDGATTKEALMDSFYKTTKDLTSVVLLMHDAPDKILTYEVLPDIIKYFKDNNYKFETMFDVIGR